MSAQIEFTFTWPESAADPALTPLTLSIKCEELAARDPKGLSLLSVKIRESGNKVVCQASVIYIILCLARARTNTCRRRSFSSSGSTPAPAL